MKNALLLTILTFALAVTLCTSMISPTQAYITNYNWLGQRHNYDPFWNSYSLTVFPEGTDATLTVTVYNDIWWANSLNISAVKIYMDWNQNYTSTECSETNPVVMSYGTSRTFLIRFEVPSTAGASNLFQHGWTIYVDQVNATSGPTEVTSHATWYGSYFVVYSAVQKEAMNLYDEIRMLTSYYWSFGSVEAQSLWYNGSMHYAMGEDSYISGNFDSAKTHYETALNLMNQAIDTETARDLDLQDYEDNYDRQLDQANLNQIETNANATMKIADATMKEAEATYALAQAAMTQAYAWIVFGIGFVIFGFAAVIWASKRPTP